jgi:HPt (histidine-containing phosphotransfer) domain-containing protein
MNDYLTKPVDLKVLRTMLERWAGPQPSKLAALSAFDGEGMDARFGGDAELKELAMAAFRQSTPPLLAKLRAAVEAVEREPLERLAHSAKGGGAMIGAERYAAIAGALEERAASAPEDELRRLQLDLQRAFDDFVEAVSAVTGR